jgi:hypothetical protein
MSYLHKNMWISLLPPKAKGKGEEDVHIANVDKSDEQKRRYVKIQVVKSCLKL